VEGQNGLAGPRAAAERILGVTARSAHAGARLLRRGFDSEWFGSPLHKALLNRPRPEGLSARPRDFRPVDTALGRQILRGEFNLGGSSLQVGPDGDPWDRPSPTYRLAVALHRYDWAPHLLSERMQGPIQALKLHLQWRRVFGAWNSFSWSAAALERRVYNYACALGPMAAGASDAEIAGLTLDLARQARHLLKVSEHPERAAERAIVTAIAATVLAGQSGDQLGVAAIARVERLLPRAVLPDGSHVSRSPHAGMEMLFDLLSLDDALTQRGLQVPQTVTGAIDRLSAALRFFTLGDARLACFQGGETGDPERIAAALARDASPTRPPDVAPHGGYHRLTGDGIMAMVDSGAPATGDCSVLACAQPFALEVVCGRDRLITNCGWSPDGGAPQAFRLTDGASTLSVADSSVGEPLSGFMAALFGPRLSGAPAETTARRHEGPDGVWLDLAHDGWGPRFGLRHGRRLFMDRKHNQLRGEDRLDPLPGKSGRSGETRPRFLPFTVRFHLHPDARASIARDQKSVLIRGASNQGWWLRSDAPEVSIEPSAHFQNGVARRSVQVVLRARARSDTGGRVRWKLAVADA
jgi:uncharacterized heparinase superfamily protein